MELPPVHLVALLGFAATVVFGFIANKTHFCVMGGISDWLYMGSKGRVGAWFLGIGIAIIGSQSLDLAGYVNLGDSIYRSANFRWLSYLVGGLIFGVGMTLAAGCAQRNLVRIGGGNLKALMVMLVMGVTGYATMRGLLAGVRVDYLDIQNVDLAAKGIADQGLITVLLAWAGIAGSVTAKAVIAMLFGLGFIGFALKQKTVRGSFDNLLVGVTIGVVAISAWYITGVVGNDDFDPVPLEGVSFVSPVANTVQYVMTYTGSTINFGIALVLGMITGSFLYAIVSGKFRLETFSTRSEMTAQLGGGALMGFGGVIGLGCNIGQGVAGMSTLAMGSIIATVSIILGSIVTMKIQYHLPDSNGFFGALRAALAELRLMPAGQSHS